MNIQTAIHVTFHLPEDSCLILGYAAQIDRLCLRLTIAKPTSSGGHPGITIDRTTIENK